MKTSNSRRKILKNVGVVGAGIPILLTSLNSCTSKSDQPAIANNTNVKPLRILILGGTSFLGPHQIAYAISRGHTISTFTRGKTKPTIYRDILKQVEQLIGDRANNLSALEDREWDIVIDNSGHDAEWTKASANLLKEKSGMYVYTSSTGVYYPYLGEDMNEDKQVLMIEPEGIEDEELKMEYWYGVMKANSEAETINAFGVDRSLIIRPTYMMGPADKTNRFIYWPIRLSRGGEVMVPGKPDDPVQYIDVRDVAEWTIRLAEQKMAGTYNAVGPRNKESIIDFVNKAKEAFDVTTSFVSIPDYNFLKQNDVNYIVPWIMPEGNNYGSARINNQKALNNGLTFRPIKKSIKDIYDWWYSDALTDEKRNDFEKKPGSILLREKAIIEQWKKMS